MGIFGAILKGVGIGVGVSFAGDLISNYCDKKAKEKAEAARAEQERRRQEALEEEERKRREFLAEQERQRKIREEERRRNTTCYFTGKVSQNDFCNIVSKIGKRMRRRLHIDNVNGTAIAATFYSQSGLSRWSFEVDFNDYGDVTGKYWWLSKCYCESNIPENFAEQIQEEIELHRSNY